ncbi:CRISPR-associated endonuclease Cas2 [Melaminivora suipulveris]|uniref:CRISPR-associated endoribonuclease Cas2 n=1 Tax=Melaminivora suipulveris TaxID=2109913 RepID=A0A2R3QBX2_9BURK|nr:CRISPR-associated endonuclease Cas2 [Melaminivora suipulveris]AVO49261.1 CRISPR-associated endonuclease Cas2 [Melaminivora suipulveris]
MRDYIICYDITCPRRLGRIHRYLKRHACAVQYSVFLFTGSPEQLERCLEYLQRLMDPRSDDIRAYPLPERGLRLCLGNATLPDGIHWSGLSAAWQPQPQQ